MSKRYEGMIKWTQPEPNNRLGSALRCCVCQKDSQSPSGISIQMGLLYCMITYCARVHVCAVCIHSCVVASCLIHTSCIIEVSEWIFSTLMEAVGPRGSAVTGKPGKAAKTWRRPAATDRLSGPTRCSPCALPKILLCLALRSWWASCAAADSWGGAEREETESVPRCKSRNGDLRRGKREGRERETECRSLWRLLSISSIDRKEWELKELHTALHLLFFCCFWCIICSQGSAESLLLHAYILTYVPFSLLWNEVHTKPAPTFSQCAVRWMCPFFLVSLIKPGDASVKSLRAQYGNLFLPVPPAKDRKKMPDEKAFMNGIPEFFLFRFLSYFLLCLLYVRSFNHCAIKTYIRPVAICMQLNRWWLWHRMNNFQAHHTVDSIQNALF